MQVQMMKRKLNERKDGVYLFKEKLFMKTKFPLL